MNPILARTRRLGLYLGVWALVGGLLAVLLAGQADLRWMDALLVALPLGLAYAFICLSAWYVARSMPAATTGAVRVAVTAIAAGILSSAAWLALARAWIALLVRADASFPDPDAGALIFGFGLLLYLLSVAVSYAVAELEQSRLVERREFAVQVLARDAELRLLRAQIDPHFLFNSLHSISALTAADPAGARRMCVLLADFLRESIALGAEARIPLARELDLVGRFLEIERVRFGDRLRVSVAAGACGACLVPPLLLQPIVENAVKHGIAHLLDGGTIEVSATCTPATLTVVVRSPCDPDRPRGPGTGVGLANVRSRLRALHGDDGRVDAFEADGQWRVDLTLPANRDQDS
jgi:signal transduction histidine kinase